eukprot:716626-Alexandrium_andersonii.AAC.1
MAKTRLAMPILSTGLTCARCRAPLGPPGPSFSHLPRSDQKAARRRGTGSRERAGPLRPLSGQPAIGDLVPA